MFRSQLPSIPQHQRRTDKDTMLDDKIAYLWVSDQEVELLEGRCVVFDDSFLPEVDDFSDVEVINFILFFISTTVPFIYESAYFIG